MFNIVILLIQILTPGKDKNGGYILLHHSG